MKSKIIVLSLFFLSPILAELLSASAPPAEFFNPISFFVISALYGCGVLLIREAKVRWNLQWSIIFLLIAYGIIEEGTMIQSFFNTAHEDLDNLSNYGMFLGVQWTWTIMLILYHSTISTIIPIKIIDFIWPEYEMKPLLKKKGLIFISFLFLLIISSFLVFGVLSKSGMYKNYNFNIITNIVTLITICLLIWLSFKYKDHRIKIDFYIMPPFIFGCLGFIFALAVYFLPSGLQESNAPGFITVLFQIFLSFITILFMIFQIYNNKAKLKHYTSIITGYIFLLILLTPIHEFADTGNPDSTSGMLIVGIVIFILLIIWNIYVKRLEFKKGIIN